MLIHFQVSSINQTIGFLDSFAPEGKEQWYLIAGASIFCFCGLVTGFFIWRRSNLQFAEMRSGKKQSETALEAFRSELDAEKKMLDDSKNTASLLKPSQKKKKRKKKDLSGRKQRGKKKADESNDPVAESFSSDTAPIEPPVNPVAKVIRGVDPIKVEDEPSSDKSLDDLFS